MTRRFECEIIAAHRIEGDEVKRKRQIMKIQTSVEKAVARMQRAFGVGLFTVVATVCFSTTASAQYFQIHEQNAKSIVIESSKFDSVIFDQMTPFALPKTNDSIQLTYHEPMPDSIMPRSAIVVGEVTLQDEDPTVLVTKLEKFARKAGADWIVSFGEPRVFHDKQGNRLFRSSAQLLRVLDPTFIQSSDLQYSYYEENKLQNYAALTNWYDSYGRQMGAKMDPIR